MSRAPEEESFEPKQRLALSNMDKLVKAFNDGSKRHWTVRSSLKDNLNVFTQIESYD